MYVNKLAKRLRRQVGQAVQDFNMIEAGGARHGVFVGRQGLMLMFKREF